MRFNCKIKPLFYMQVCQGSTLNIAIAGLVLCMNIKLEIKLEVMALWKASQNQFLLEKRNCFYTNSYELGVTWKQNLSQQCRFKLNSVGANDHWCICQQFIKMRFRKPIFGMEEKYRGIRLCKIFNQTCRYFNFKVLYYTRQFLVLNSCLLYR